MYFDITPKENRKNLFGRDYLLRTLVSHLEDPDVRLLVLKGLRRTGKTSLLNVALMEIKYKYVKIDVREAPYYDRKEFMSYVIKQVRAVVGESLFRKIMQQISKVELSYKDLSAAFYLEIEQQFLTFWKDLQERLHHQNKFFVLALDEVQLLSAIEFNVILAALYDNYKNIKLVVTGSEIGLMDQFLGKREAKSPLYGRATIEIEVNKLTNEQISQFLEEGFHQLHHSITLTEIQEIIGNFDGLIGWATQYGWYRSKNFLHRQALLKVIEEGSKLIKMELESFLGRRKKTPYLKLLRWIAQGHNRWNLLKYQFVRENRSVSDQQLHFYLRELIEYSFVEKINETYFITDPMLIRALE